MLTATAHCQFLQGLYWLHPAHQGAAHGIRHSGIMRLGKHTEVQPGPHLCPGHTWGPSEAQPALGKGRTHLKNRKGKGKKKKKTTTNKRTLYLHKLQKKKKKESWAQKKPTLKKGSAPWGPITQQSSEALFRCCWGLQCPKAWSGCLGRLLSLCRHGMGACRAPQGQGRGWEPANPGVKMKRKRESATGTGVGVWVCWGGWCGAWLIRGGCDIGEKVG